MLSENTIIIKIWIIMWQVSAVSNVFVLLRDVFVWYPDCNTFKGISFIVVYISIVNNFKSHNFAF